MTTIPLYHIEDRETKRAYLPLIIQVLNHDSEIKSRGIRVADGFATVSGRKGYCDVKALYNALKNPDHGVFLVDLLLESDDDLALFENLEQLLLTNDAKEHQEITKIRAVIVNALSDLSSVELSSLVLATCVKRGWEAWVVSTQAKDYADLLAEDCPTLKTVYFPANWGKTQTTRTRLAEKASAEFKALLMRRESLSWDEFLDRAMLLSHKACQSAASRELLRRYLQFNEQEFELYFSTSQGLIAEALKCIAGAKRGLQLHAMWLLALGLFREWFPQSNWKEIWWNEQILAFLMKHKSADLAVRQQGLRRQTLERFKSLCHQVFIHKKSTTSKGTKLECVLRRVELTESSLSFITKIPFDELRDTLVETLRDRSEPSRQPSAKHKGRDTSTAITDLWIVSSFSDDASNEVFVPHARMNVRRTDEGGTEVRFG